LLLSVAIIARDEERHIGACLASVDGFADEVVVLLDDRSGDRTAAICQQRGALVYREPWRGYPAQRNRALELCRGDWTLFVDADERVTPALRDEIRTILTPNDPLPTQAIRQREQTTAHADNPAGGSPAHPATAGYWIPRYNLFFNRRLRGGGWYPDHQLRFLRRTQARYDEQRLVHELVHLDGAAGYLNGHLLHYNIERLDEFWPKQTGYALAEARTLYGAGQRTRWRNFLGAPTREFWRRYVTLGGWRDGGLGLFLCASLAWFEVVKYGFLYLLQKTHPAR
jgi:glycosyltransferase involved in cell wall biosynthesis